VPPHERPREGLRATSESVEETLREVLDVEHPLHPANYSGLHGFVWYEQAMAAIAQVMAERREQA